MNYELPDSRLKLLLVCLMKLTLQNTQTLRKIKATVWDAVEFPTSSPIVAALAKELDEYLNRCRQIQSESANGKHGLGPPSGYLLLALVDALLEAEIGARNRKALQPMSEILWDMELPKLCQMCSNILMQTTNEEKTTIIYFDLANVGTYKEDENHPVASTRDLLLSSLEMAGGTPLPGAAPPGFLENRLSQLLTAIEKS